MKSRKSLKPSQKELKMVEDEAGIDELVDQLKHKIKVSFPEQNDGKIKEKIASLLGIERRKEVANAPREPKIRKKRSKKILTVGKSRK